MANTRKCVGITAFEWWIADNNAFSQRKQPQTLKTSYFIMLTGPWTLVNTWFQAFSSVHCPRKWKKTYCIRRKTSVKTMFCCWKTPVNNKIQTVFPSFNRALNTRKTVVFVELTVKENCSIMERILQCAGSITTGKLQIFFFRKCQKMRE